MRLATTALLGTCLLGAALAFGLGAAPARALTATEQRDLALEQANAANALAVNIRAALNPERCLTVEQALAAIQNATSGAQIQTIASALDIVAKDRWWCGSVQDALAAAGQAAQLALATSSDTAATPAQPRLSSVRFELGPSGGEGAAKIVDTGSPGGEGGSGYLN